MNMACLIAVLGLQAMLAGAADDIVLANKGRSEYSIAIAPDAGTREQFAATELQKYVKAVSGAELALNRPDAKQVISISVSKRNDLDLDDGFTIEADGKNLKITGSNERSAVYAVYAFLERHLGCRWPTPQEEVVPKLDAIRLKDVKMAQQAGMRVRGLIATPWWGPFGPGIVDWMAKNRMNFVIIGYPAGYEESVEWRTANAAEAMWKKRGFMLAAGHHSFDFFVPPKTHFAAHPEYFALLGGQRKPAGRSVQLCLSNPAVADVYVENVVAFGQRHPEVKMLALFPNDGFGWCQCDGCRKFYRSTCPIRPELKNPAASDLYMDFMNRVVPRISAKLPDRVIASGAYVNYAQAPETVKPLSTMSVFYAVYDRNYYKDPMPDSLKITNPDFPYMSKNIADWGHQLQGKGDLIIYEYYNGGVFCHWQEIPLLELIAKEMSYYRAQGANGCITQYSSALADVCAVNTYALARFTWEPGATPRAVLEDYCTARYGKAGPSMLKFYQAREDNGRHHSKIWGRSAESDAACQQYLDEAKAAADTEQVKQRVKIAQDLFTKFRKW